MCDKCETLSSCFVCQMLRGSTGQEMETTKSKLESDPMVLRCVVTPLDPGAAANESENSCLTLLTSTEPFYVNGTFCNFLNGPTGALNSMDDHGDN